jgi:hypothetical protein
MFGEEISRSLSRYGRGETMARELSKLEQTRLR